MDTTSKAFETPPVLFDTPTDTGVPSSAKPGPRRSRWLRRLAYAFVGLAALAGTGATYEAIASYTDATPYPQVGRLVDIGDHRLYIECEGTGGPVVVMDAGLGGSSFDWFLVRTKLAESTRVCTYDRAGMGSSEPGPLPRSPGRNAEELHRLLEAAAIEGPYVLVAHSLGGKNARMFAAAYPGDVAGMVLVDARGERMDLDATEDESDRMNAAMEAQANLYAIARRLGLVRLFGATLFGSPKVPQDAALQLVLRETAPDAIAATLDEGIARSADDAALAQARLGDLPLVVVAAADSMATLSRWPAEQNRLAELSSNGRLIIAGNSGHAIQFDAPGVVVDAVLSVLADARERN